MTPDLFLELHGDKIPYSDRHNQEMFAQAVIDLQSATGIDNQLWLAINADVITPTHEDDPGPEFAVILKLIGPANFCDFGLDLFNGLSGRGDDVVQRYMLAQCRKGLSHIHYHDERFNLLLNISAQHSDFIKKISPYLPKEISIKLWLDLVKINRHDVKRLIKQCPVPLDEVQIYFDGSENIELLLSLVKESKGWIVIRSSLESHQNLRKAVASEILSKKEGAIGLEKEFCCLSDFKDLFAICLDELLNDLNFSLTHFAPFMNGQNNLLSDLSRIIKQGTDFSSYRNNNILIVLHAINTTDANKWHWDWFKSQLPLKAESLGNLPDRWPEFPVIEFILFAEEHPELLDCLLRSPRLAAIATLFPERTVSILIKRIEDANRHRIALQPSPSCCVISSGDFEHKLGHEHILDFGELLRGREDLLALISNPSIEILGLVGTQEALSRAEELYSQLPIGIDDDEGKSRVSEFPNFRKSQVSELAYLCQFPGNHKWLRSIITKRRDLIRYFIEGGIKKIGNWRCDADKFFINLIEEIELIPEVFNRYATKNRDLVPAWYNLILRLVPDCNPVEFTIKFQDEREVTQNYLVEGVVKLELKKLIESRRFNDAMNLINANNKYVNPVGTMKSREILGVLEYCSQSITYISDELRNYEELISARRPGSIFEKSRDELKNQEKEVLRKIESETKSFYALLTVDDYFCKDSKTNKLLEFLLPIDRSLYVRQIQEFYERRHSVPDTKDLGLVDVTIQTGRERIFEKMTRFATGEGIDPSTLKEGLSDSYPSRSMLEKVLVKKFDWPPGEDGNKTFKFLDRLDDDLLPGILRTSISSLVRSDGNPWDANSDLSRMLRRIYPDYCQPWARAICRVLDDHESIDPKWVRALCICLALLREPVGSKVPLKLKELANHPRYLSFQEVLQQQAAQFNRENLKKGQARRDELKVKDAKQYLAKTSRMVHA